MRFVIVAAFSALLAAGTCGGAAAQSDGFQAVRPAPAPTNAAPRPATRSTDPAATVPAAPRVHQQWSGRARVEATTIQCSSQMLRIVRDGEVLTGTALMPMTYQGRQVVVTWAIAGMLRANNAIAIELRTSEHPQRPGMVTTVGYEGRMEGDQMRLVNDTPTCRRVAVLRQE